MMSMYGLRRFVYSMAARERYDAKFRDNSLFSLFKNFTATGSAERGY